MQNKLKVLFLSSGKGNGGANIAAYSLYKNMQECDEVCAKYVCVDNHPYYFLNSYISKINNKLSSMISRGTHIFSWSFIEILGIQRTINAFKPDVIHLHWTSLGILKKITKSHKIKIVVTLHDMRAFTNGCHYSEECEGFTDYCHNCEFVKLPALLLPNYLRGKYPINYIAPSTWMLEKLKASSFFDETKDTAQCIPNLKNDFMGQKHSSVAKRKILSTGAMNFDYDSRKGIEFLAPFLEHYDGPEIGLIVYGLRKRELILKTLPMNTQVKLFCFGKLCQKQLEKVYTISDGALFLSKHENFSNILLDNLSHGNFAVCFDIGGNKDIVDHNITGYVADAYNIIDIIDGVKQWAISNKDVVFDNTRRHFEKRFSKDLLKYKHLMVYQGGVQSEQ